MTPDRPVEAPVVGPPAVLRPPRVAETKLASGMRVLAVRKPTVPRLEMRLLIPLDGGRDAAAERMHAKTLTSGTSTRTSSEIAQELQRLGGSVSAGTGRDHFHISGSVLSMNARAFMELVADVLSEAEFPSDEVDLERERIVQEVTIERSQPQMLAAEALRKQMFGRHRYAVVVPEPTAVSRVGRATVRRQHRERLGPRGSTLVIVGDFQPSRVLELVASTLGGWRRKRARLATDLPPPSRRRRTLLVDRPGSVQTNIRIAGPVPPVTAEASFAVDLANTIFGGYFISRLTENLRERRGYTYTPHSRIHHHQLASYMEVAADVGAEVTLPALLETRYELGRMAALPVEERELEAAKRYLTGTGALRIQSQAGLAGTLAGLVVYGLDVSYLRTYPQRIQRLTARDVQEAALEHLAPSGLTTVLVGDASRIGRDLAALDEVQVQTVKS